MNKVELEKLIRKPRAFRHHTIANDIPPRQTMIILGAETLARREIHHNLKRIILMHKDSCAERTKI